LLNRQMGGEAVQSIAVDAGPSGFTYAFG
jgi:hypothetical protein